MPFDQLIFRKIIKAVAARGHILRVKCTKFYFGWGSTLDPAGVLTVLTQTPLAGLMESTAEKYF